MTTIFRRYTTEPSDMEPELHAHSGQEVTVLGPVDPAEYDEEVGPMVRIRFADGFEADAYPDEIKENTMPTQLQEDLRAALAEVEAQRGGITPVTEARDRIAETIDSTDMPALAEQGYRTAFPYSEIERWGMPVYPADINRVFVKPEDDSVTSAERWRTTTDLISGLEIQMRRADCGAGCRCATEVKFLGGFGR